MALAQDQFDCEVTIIGAGPYGLSAAAHLKTAQIPIKVFGKPLSFWREHMPQGMKMRSGWNVTTISDPYQRLTLDRYAQHTGFERPDLLSLEQFIAYGEWFRKHAVPEVDTRRVERVDLGKNGFCITLSDGTSVKTQRVVIATGLANQEYKPAEFADLPRELVSHAAEHDNLGKFSGKRIAVIGRGQSACECAALLSNAGAQVELIARGEINWLGTPENKFHDNNFLLTQFRSMLSAPSGVGPFPVSWLNELPGVVHRLPQSFRDKLNSASLGAGVTGWVKPGLERVRTILGKPIQRVQIAGDQIAISLQDEVCTYDHVLLGTGFRIDISKTGLFTPALLNSIMQIDGSPRLRRGFESTVAGLHFLGANAVKSYGPLMRFIAGSAFAARELTRAIAATQPDMRYGVQHRAATSVTNHTEAVSGYRGRFFGPVK